MCILNRFDALISKIKKKKNHLDTFQHKKTLATAITFPNMYFNHITYIHGMSIIVEIVV